MHPPALLLVNIPRTDRWEFAYYSTFVLAKYPHYLESGFITDNSVKSANLWFKPLDRLPDYAVVLKASGVEPSHAGIKVAETKDLALYRVVANDLETVRQEFGRQE
jgi:hypothetical protein